MPNERDLIALIKSIKSLSHKYDEDMDYYNVSYHTLLHLFMMFRQDDDSNSEYTKKVRK